MLIKIAIGFVVVLAGFLGYVSTRSGKFYYERSGVIKAAPTDIIPYLTDLQLGEQWSPYEKGVEGMIKKISGAAGVGQKMEWEGNSTSGSGRLEILHINQDKSVELKLTMLEPFYGENKIIYTLIPESGGTKFSWSMEGEGGFMSKLMGVVMDCEKMIGDQFTLGINNLKTLVESKKTNA